MSKGILVVESSPSAPERDAEYNAWYNDIHLIDVLKVSGFTGARRFRKHADDGHNYFAIYEVEADDLQEALTNLGAATKSGELRMSDAIQTEPAPSLTLYEEIYERSA